MIWFGVTTTIGLAIVYLFSILAKQLRENHSAVYREVGEPSLIPEQLAAAKWEFFRFIWFGEFRQLGDPRINRLCAMLILLQLGFVIWIFWPLIL